MDTSASSDLLARVAGSAAAQFDAAGGCVLPPSAPTTRAARDAFVLIQQAAALDVAALEAQRALHALNNSGAQRQPPPPEPAPLAGHKKRAADDESDGNALQGELVAAHVRAGKTIETLDPGAAHAAPDGSLRLVQPGFLGEEACSSLVAAGVVAMAGAFSRCGQTTLGVSPALAPRARGLWLAEGGSLAPALYLTVERVRRRVAAAFGADASVLRVSDATMARLRPHGGGGDAAAAGGGDLAAARAAGALDVGALRGDRFVYWRPHVDQVSVADYDYSALLYLTRHGDHFEGGRLIFHDGDADRRVEPTPGLLVAFASGAANLHAVTRVTRGVRFALTMWFSLQPAAAAAPAEHSELQRWARDAFDAELAGAPPPPPPPPPPAAADGASADGKGGCAVGSRDAELASAALCSLPANEPLCQALVLARQAHGGGGLVHTLARGVGVGVEEAHCAPRPAEGAAAAADDDGAASALRTRAHALDALATTLQRARAAQTSQAAAGGGADAPAAAAAQDAFSVFD